MCKEIKFSSFRKKAYRVLLFNVQLKLDVAGDSMSYSELE